MPEPVVSAVSALPRVLVVLQGEEDEGEEEGHDSLHRMRVARVHVGRTGNVSEGHVVRTPH